MDNAIVLGTLATVCAAVIGAVATIAAALISRNRVWGSREQEVQSTPPIETRSLGDGTLRIRENMAVVVSEVELAIAVHLVILDDQINFEYRTPQMKKPFVAKNVKSGFQRLIEHDDKTYALTLVRIDGINKDAFFDLRQVTKTSKRSSKQPITPDLPQEEITGTCPFCGAQYTTIGKPKNCSYCGMKFS